MTLTKTCGFAREPKGDSMREPLIKGNPLKSQEMALETLEFLDLPAWISSGNPHSGPVSAHGTLTFCEPISS